MKKHLLSLSLSAGIIFSVHAQSSAPLDVPCTAEIESETSLTEQFTTLDTNNDGTPYCWEFDASETAAHYTQNTKKAADDWIFSPPVTLHQGKTYTITVNIKHYSTFGSDKQAFTITAGQEATPGGQSSKLYSESAFNSKLYVNREAKFTPSYTGTYHFGFHLTSNSYMGDMYFKSISVNEVLAHPAAVESITVTPGENGVLSATVGWTFPSTTQFGGALDENESLTARIYRSSSRTFNADESTFVASVSGTAGSAGTYVDNTITSAGVQYYKIYTDGSNGTTNVAATAFASPWIGPDTDLKAVTNLKATEVEGREHVYAITFDFPEGSNGAYVDPEAVTFIVSRTLKSPSTTVTLAEGLKFDELPFIDETIDAMGTYTYNVKTVYNGKTAWSGATSAEVKVTMPMSVPYSQDFNSTSALEYFTIFHGEEGKRDWQISSNALNYWGSPADAWALTPRIALEEGKAYKLSFTARVNRAASPKELYVYIGTQPDAESLVSTQLFHETISNTLAEPKEVTVSVPQSGNYYIAFRCYGPSDSNDIYVDDLSVTETVVIPNPVENLTATASEQGIMEAVLQWTNPASDNTGNALSSPLTVKILRGETEIALLEDRTAGAADTYTDTTVAEPGKYTYSVTVVMGDKESDAAEAVSTWIGPDTPLAVTEIAVEETGSGRVVTFTAPAATGVNGGYVDTEAVTYTISRNEDVLAEDLTETVFTDPTPSIELPLGSYTYTVTPHFNGLTGESASSASMILGDALPLPYEADFADADHFLLWTMPKNSSNGGFSYNAGGYLTSGLGNGSKWMFSAPFNAEEGEGSVTIRGYCYNFRYPEAASVYLVDSTEIPDIEENPEENVTAISYAATSGNYAAKIADLTFENASSYTDPVTSSFSIPAKGKYYIAFNMPQTNMELKINKFNVVQDVISSIDNVTSGAGNLAYLADIHTVAADTGEVICIYNATGALVATGRGSVSVESLPAGMYIARTHGQATLKFAR